jgi:hypothetical protein
MPDIEIVKADTPRAQRGNRICHLVVELLNRECRDCSEALSILTNVTAHVVVGMHSDPRTRAGNLDLALDGLRAVVALRTATRGQA